MKDTYNTRTLAACAKRLRWMTNELDTMPTWSIVWRWREGFRLQIDGEQHEPGGCLWMDGTDPYGRDRTTEVEDALAKGQADQAGYDCLSALLECTPEAFDDESLRHLSMSTEGGKEAPCARRAFEAMYQRACERKGKGANP